MFADFVFPNNNEEEFLQMAKRLGISRILFCYPCSKKPNAQEYILAGLNEPEKAPQNAPIVSFAADRAAFESQNSLLICGLEGLSGKDSMHTRHSGLNHILAELAHKNNHTICFSPHLFPDASTQNFPTLLGRMMQNVELCRKYMVKMKLASFAKSPYQLRAAMEMKSFGCFLGMVPMEAKSALGFNPDLFS